LIEIASAPTMTIVLILILLLYWYLPRRLLPLLIVVLLLLVLQVHHHDHISIYLYSSDNSRVHHPISIPNGEGYAVVSPIDVWSVTLCFLLWLMMLMLLLLRRRLLQLLPVLQYKPCSYRSFTTIFNVSFKRPSSMSHMIHWSGRALLLTLTVHIRNTTFNRHVSITWISLIS